MERNFNNERGRAALQVLAGVVLGAAFLLFAGAPIGIENGELVQYSLAERWGSVAVVFTVLLTAVTYAARRGLTCEVLTGAFALGLLAASPGVRAPLSWIGAAAAVGAVAVGTLLGCWLGSRRGVKKRRMDRRITALLRFMPAALLLLAGAIWGKLVLLDKIETIPVMIPGICLFIPTLIAARIEFAMKYSRRMMTVAVMAALAAMVVRVMVYEPLIYWYFTR